MLTIGYEGATLEDFVATLQAAGVTMLLDVRELPISRRKGFSKRGLSEALLAAGIAYRHESSLGSPRSIRKQLYADGDYKVFFDAFTTYLKSQKPLLNELSKDVDGTVALMCFERDPLTCHRSIVARHLEPITRLKTKHIGVRHGIASEGARAGLGEGLPSA